MRPQRIAQIIVVILICVVGLYFLSNASSNLWNWIGYDVYRSDTTRVTQTPSQTPSRVTTARPTIVYREVLSTNYLETTSDLIRWKSVQEERRVRMHRECEFLNLKSEMLTQQGTPARHILVNDKYKLMYCFIPKVASSNWRKVFMVLEGQYNTVDEITGSKIDYFHLPLLSTYSQEEINYRLKNYHSFIAVRHPLERLISAWHNKFEEGLYYKQALVKTVIKYTRFNGSNPAKVDIKDIQFSEFIKYLTQSKDQGVNDEHWNTYVNLCAPCRVNYTYIAFTDDMINEASMILNVTGAGAVVDFPRTKVNPKHSSLSVQQIISHWRSVPDNLFKAIIDRYSIDIRLFGYTEPKLVDDYIRTLQ